MATTYTPRREPCTHCGENVVITETRVTGLGGMWKRAPVYRVEHADFLPRRRGEADRIDDECTRPPITRRPANRRS